MTFARRLHIGNRSAELHAKYGRLSDEALPPWLDSLEGFRASVPQDEPEPAQEPPVPAEPPGWWVESASLQNRVSERSEGKPPRTADW